MYLHNMVVSQLLVLHHDQIMPYKISKILISVNPIMAQLMQQKSVHIYLVL